MVMEAVHLKVQLEDAELQEKAQKEAERRSFKKDHSALDKFR